MSPLPRSVTATERKVAFALWDKKRVPVIAREFKMEISTVRSHIRALAGKLPNPHGLPAVKLIMSYSPLKVLAEAE